MPRKLRITVVPGTWHKGFPFISPLLNGIKRLFRMKRSTPWYEKDGYLETNLAAALKVRSIECSFTKHIEWSGANSFSHREAAAEKLKDQLSRECNDKELQLVIAHSHGGNVALRAYHKLKEANDAADPYIITLATPFVEVFKADIDLVSGLVRTIVTAMIAFFASYIGRAFLEWDDSFSILVNLAAFGLIFFTWQKGLSALRVEQINHVRRITKDATRTWNMNKQQMAVIRAVDDEASLLIETAIGFKYVALLGMPLSVLGLMLYAMGATVIGLVRCSLPGGDVCNYTGMFEHWVAPALPYLSWLNAIFFVIYMFVRMAHGRELAWSPMECQINTQTVPDSTYQSATITLVQNDPLSHGLRHGIYEHPDCVRLIAESATYWATNSDTAQPSFEFSFDYAKPLVDETRAATH